MTAMAISSDADTITLDQLARCYEGGIPAVVCTADGDGVPNITYVSRVHQVDRDRIAVSNQFMSKTSRNIAVNPVASVLLIDPVTHDEFRLEIVYERTERRGPVFERLRDDVEELAEIMGLRDVFRLRAADIYRVTSIERIGRAHHDDPSASPPARSIDALAAFAERLGRSSDLDMLIDHALAALDQVLGYRHVSLLLLDETGTRLYAIASRGFPDEHVGAEIELGVGPIGGPIERCTIHRSTGLRQLAKYSRTVRASFEAMGVRPGRDVPAPTLPDADSRVVVPIRSLGELVGAIVVEDPSTAAFTEVDEHVLGTVAAIIGPALEHARLAEPTGPGGPLGRTRPGDAATAGDDVVRTRDDGSVRPPATMRFFEVDGSAFIDGDYLIKGVAGRILRSLVAEHLATGRESFTNRELRLDASLDLPGFKDNLESRLILLKRRLDERRAPCRIERTGRGRFSFTTTRTLELEIVPDG